MKRDFAREPGVSVFLRLELLMEKWVGIRCVLIDHKLTVNRISYSFRKDLWPYWLHYGEGKTLPVKLLGWVHAPKCVFGRMMELVDLPDSKSGVSACGFESHFGHQGFFP